MTERIFLKILTIVMSCGLIGLILFPAAHIGRGFWKLAGIFIAGIAVISVYRALRKRFALSILAERGPVRRLFWFLLSVPSLVLILVVVVDLFNRTLPPFHDALLIMEQSGVAKSRVGDPVKVGWPIEGSSAVSGDSGRTVLRIPIAGKSGRGTLIVNGTKTGGVWNVDEVRLVTGESNTTVSILPSNTAH